MRSFPGWRNRLKSVEFEAVFETAMNRGLKSVYARRFARTELRRDKVWRVLTRHYFQGWVRPTDAVLDVGAGYCEFINHIQAAQKFALDLNPATQSKAGQDVKVLAQGVTTRWAVPSASIDLVFTSNCLEHLTSKDDLKHCLDEIYRVLRPNGLLMAMGPNIRFCFDVYWDFFDHYLPLSDRSLLEAMELCGFRREKVVPRFLPFTMTGRMPTLSLFVRLYLLLPICWRVLGKQFLIVARKPHGPTS